MKLKLLNLGLVLTSLIGYLKWGGNNTAFLAEAEAEVLKRLLTEPTAVLHPFTVLPLLGQIFLLFTLFQRRPSRLLSLIGLICIGMLLVLMFLIGIFAPDIAILLSAVTFLLFAAFVIVEIWKSRGSQE